MTFGLLMLLIAPVISLLVIRFLGPTRGVAVAFLGGALFLPASGGLDLPMFPGMGRSEITALSIFVGLLLFQPARFERIRREWRLDLMLIAYLALGFATAFANRDALVDAHRFSGGLSLKDGALMAAQDFLRMAVPFVAARTAYRSPTDLRAFARALVGFSVVYGLLALFEVRFSPQLHRWVYGFHPHDFSQQMKYGGFRPMVFLGSGIATSLLLALGAVATVTLGRAHQLSGRHVWASVALFLVSVLLLCKTMSALLYTAVALPVVLLCSSRTQFRCALVLAAAATLYPALRIASVFPTERIIALAGSVDQDRAASLRYRLQNEELLIDYGLQRPLLGYGIFNNRTRIYNPEIGRSVITDGFWIIQFSGRGVLGLATIWLPLVSVVFMAWRARRQVRDVDDRILLSGTALLLAVQCIDLLPNGLYTPLQYFTAGALAGSLAGVKGAGANATAATAGRARAEPARRKLRLSSLR